MKQLNKIILMVITLLCVSSFSYADIVLNEEEVNNILDYREYVKNGGLSQVEQYNMNIACFNFNETIRSINSIYTDNLIHRNNIVCEDLYFLNDLSKTDDKLHKSIKNLASTVYNKYGQVSRNQEIHRSDVDIFNMGLRVENYTKNLYEPFQVVLYTGNHNVTYQIVRSENNFNTENLSGGDYENYKLVTSKFGYIKYNTSGFSTQVATIPNQQLEDQEEVGLSLDFFFNNAENYNIDICKEDNSGNEECFWDSGDAVNIQAGNGYYPTGSEFYEDTNIKFGVHYDTTYTNSEGFEIDYTNEGAISLESKTDSHNQKYKLYVTARDNTGSNPTFTSFYVDVSGTAVTGPTIKNQDIQDAELIGTGSTCYNLNNNFDNYDEVSVQIPTEYTGSPTNFNLQLDTTTVGSSNFNEEIEVTLTKFSDGDVNLCINGNDITYNEDLTVSVFNQDTGASGGTSSSFNVNILEQNAQPFNTQTFSNYNVVGTETINRIINDYYSNFDSVTITIDGTTYTVNSGSSDDTENIVNSNFDAILQYKNTPDNFIFDVTGKDTDSETDVQIEVCNDTNCINKNFIIYTDIESTSNGVDLNALDSATELYYSFDDDDLSGSDPLDLTSNGYNGDNFGATTGAVGVLNEAFGYTSNTQRVELPNIVSGKNKLVFSTWVNFNSINSGSAGADRTYITTNIAGSQGERPFNVWLEETDVLYLYINSNLVATINTNIQLNQDYNIAVFLDGSDIKTFINGNLIDTTSFSQTLETTTNSQYLGGRDIEEGKPDFIQDETIFLDDTWENAGTAQELAEYFWNDGAPTSDEQYPYSSGTPTQTDIPEQTSTIQDLSLVGIDNQKYFLDNFFNNYDTVNIDVCEIDTQGNEDCFWNDGDPVVLQAGAHYTTETDTFSNSDVDLTLEVDYQNTGSFLSGIRFDSKNVDSRYKFYLTVSDENNENKIFVDPFELITAEETTLTTEEFTTPIPETLQENDNYIENINSGGINSISITYSGETITSTENENIVKSILNNDIDVYLNSVNDEYILEVYSNIDLNSTITFDVEYDTQDSGIITDTITANTEETPSNGGVTNGDFSYPSWIPEPEESQKPFWSIIIIVFTIIMLSVSVPNAYLISISVISELVLLSYIGWLPQWVTILILVIVAGFITSVLSKFTGIQRGE